jgi:hypothetical protein
MRALGWAFHTNSDGKFYFAGKRPHVFFTGSFGNNLTSYSRALKQKARRELESSPAMFVVLRHARYCEAELWNSTELWGP